MVTACEPHEAFEKVTLPLCFLTVMVNEAAAVPVTLAEAGET